MKLFPLEKGLFVTYLIVTLRFTKSNGENSPKINELYLKPSVLENENEEYAEILFPTDSNIHEYALVLIDQSFILDYVEFDRMYIIKGAYDVNNDKSLVVISNNDSTPNVYLFNPNLNLRTTSTQALLLIRKPMTIIDINKLELKQIVKSTITKLRLTQSAPLTNGNKAVLKRLMLDIVVYRNSQNEEEVTTWIQSIDSRWTGRSRQLPTGDNDILDKVSLARCDQESLSGFSFRHDTPTPGIQNLCKYNTDTSQLLQPAGLSLLQESRSNPHQSQPSENPPDTSEMEASEESQVSSWLEQLDNNGMLVKHAKEFFKTHKSRKFYSFIPNSIDFTKSHIRCELCYRMHTNPRTSIAFGGKVSTTPSIMTAEGQQFRSHARNTWKQIKDHEEDFPFHKKALEQLAKLGANDQSDVYEEIPPSTELTITADKISLVYLEVKVGLSIRAHEVLSEGLLHLGFPLGQNLNGQKAAHDIIHFLGSKLHSNLIQRLIKSDVEFSLMLDASTDVGLVHTILIYIRYTEDGMPVVKVLTLTEAHDSTANGMWDVIEKAIVAEGEDFVSYFKRRCVAMSTDGASNMLGNFNSLKTRISAYVLTGERAGKQFQTYHCANHKLALAYNDVMYSSNAALAFCKRMTDNCNSLAKFYSVKSYKRRDELLSESKDVQESIRSFKRIQKVRWVPATQTSYEVVIQNFKTFMSHLEKVTDPAGTYNYLQDSKTAATKLKNTFSDKNFISTLHLHLDVIQEFSKWAKTLEKRESTVIDLELWFTQVKQAIENMKQASGPNLEQFLKNCRCGNIPCATLSMYEQSNDVVWKDIILSEKNIQNFGIPKLSQTRNLLLSTLVDSLRLRFPPEAISAFSVLLPSFLHLRSDSQWHNLGIYLHQFYDFPTSISIDLIKLKNIIVASDFHNQYSEDPPEVYWPNAFRNQEFQWTNELRRVIRIALVQPSSTAQVESGFSLVTAIKTKYRSRLATPIVQDTLRVKFNGPSVLYLPKFRLARDWINAGHLRADTVKRHKSLTILKRSEFVQTMRF